MGKLNQMMTYGSSSINVKQLQDMLNQRGYNLQVDGIFGQKTEDAVKDYQQQNGLSVDGIVGDETWGSLTGGTASTGTNTGTSTGTSSTTISAPTAAPLPDKPTYDTTSWDSTTKGDGAKEAYTNAQNAVNAHGDFKYDYQTQLDAIMKSILNGEKFSYNFNEDALYQQYKDKYIQQGKMAMADAMGQAAAMTGGYGNSYAATVGNQAYQQSLGQLNDVIPELYQMAYDRYLQDKQDLYNQYGMLSDDYARGYGEHQDKYNKLMDALGIARSDYYDGADMFYTEQNNKNSVAGQTFTDAMSIWNANNTNAWNEAEWNRDQAWRNEDYEYQASRDAVADDQWKKQYEASIASGSESTGGNTSYNNGADDKGTFNKAVFSRTDADGNNVFYINGKEQTFAPGVNPYTGTKNKDVANGTFSNGYQPNNVNGKPLSKAGDYVYVNGVKQNVWKTPDGQRWIWDGTENKYFKEEEIEYSN